MKLADSAERPTTAVTANLDDLTRYLGRRLGDTTEAADVLNDAMVAAWSNVSKLPSSPVESRMWLFALTRSALLNARRGRNRRLAATSALVAALQAAAVRQLDTDVGLRVDVERAILRLPPSLAELIRLVHGDGFTLAEAAKMLGIPASTARSQHIRAKELLRASRSLAVPQMSTGNKIERTDFGQENHAHSPDANKTHVRLAGLLSVWLTP